MQNTSASKSFLSRALQSLALGCVLTGCASGPSQSVPAGMDTEWVRASSSLAQEIDRQATVLPYAHGRERVDLISWFAVVGEPAYPTLIDFLADDRPAVIASALASLGATGDSRLVPYLQNAVRENWTEVLVLECARARVRLGDWGAMPDLIDGLESEDAIKRSLCAQTLFQATREKMGYEARGESEDRAVAVERWRTWWGLRDADTLLAQRD